MQPACNHLSHFTISGFCCCTSTASMVHHLVTNKEMMSNHRYRLLLSTTLTFEVTMSNILLALFYNIMQSFVTYYYILKPALLHLHGQHGTPASCYKQTNSEHSLLHQHKINTYWMPSSPSWNAHSWNAHFTHSSANV